MKWFVIYHDSPEEEFEQEQMPDHNDRSIKFIYRELTNGNRQHYVAIREGWGKPVKNMRNPVGNICQEKSLSSDISRRVPR